MQNTIRCTAAVLMKVKEPVLQSVYQTVVVNKADIEKRISTSNISVIHLNITIIKQWKPQIDKNFVY